MYKSPQYKEAVFLDDLEPVEVVAWAEQRFGFSDLEIVQRPDIWDEEIASIPDDVQKTLGSIEWRWIIYPWRRMAVRIPTEEAYWAIVTSRNYPIVSRVEQATMRQATALVIGLSTGRAVAQQLARLGVGRFVLADADIMAPSNFNRLLGSGLADLGLPKVTSVGRELLELNPYLQVVEQAIFVDQETCEQLITEHGVDVIIEMIDNVDAKVGVRRAARKHGLPVVMATDMDWDPYIDIESPTAPIFNGRLTDSEITELTDPATDFQNKTRLVMQFMGLDSWADRSMLSGQLAGEGLVRFWSQTAPAAATAGALAARAVFDILRGNHSLPKRAGVSLRDPLKTSDPVDETEPLVVELRSRRTLVN